MKSGWQRVAIVLVATAVSAAWADKKGRGGDDDIFKRKKHIGGGNAGGGGFGDRNKGRGGGGNRDFGGGSIKRKEKPIILPKNPSPGFDNGGRNKDRNKGKPIVVNPGRDRNKDKGKGKPIVVNPGRDRNKDKGKGKPIVVNPGRDRNSVIAKENRRSRKGRDFVREKMGNNDVRKSFTNKEGRRVQFTRQHNGRRIKKEFGNDGKLRRQTIVRTNRKTGRKEISLVKRKDDGSWVTIRPNGSKVVRYADGREHRYYGKGREVIRTRHNRDNNHYSIRIRDHHRYGNFERNCNYERRQWRRHGRSWNFYVDYYVWNPYVYYPYIVSPWTYRQYYVWSPWYVSYYGYWYRPYPYYVRPIYWITDYIILDMLEDDYYDRIEYNDDQEINDELQSAYQDLEDTEHDLADDEDDRFDNSPYDDGGGDQQLDDAAKEQLAQQVEESMDDFEKQQPTSLEKTLDNPEYIYAVNTEISAVEVDSGNVCMLSQGDLLKVAGPLTPADEELPNVTMIVQTAKGADACAAGAKVNVSKVDLQGMLNDFATRVEDGMKKLNEEGNAGRLTRN